MDHFIKLYKKKGKDLRKDVRAVQKEGGRAGQEGTRFAIVENIIVQPINCGRS